MPELSAEVKQAKQRFSIIGNAPALINAISRAIRVAPIDLSVLVTGESGSGKEFFPKIIHQYGARKHKKYIAVNCGAIPEGTIDSELFGHEKGSFTGAIAARKGYFEEADGGTIFLDEVAELPLTTQARLLRVLETGEYLKVGSSEVQKTNVRIVAATNVDLIEAVKHGKFREDLYYRLSTIHIEVPNLHDRGDDINLLARKFASDFAERYMTSPISFSDDAFRAMRLYRWPGNVRQLKNIVEQLALFHAGETISKDMFLETLPIDKSGLSTPVASKNPYQGYEQEREMLWKMIFSLKGEIAELRTLINDKNSAHGADTFFEKEHPESASRINALMKLPSDDLFSNPAVTHPGINDTASLSSSVDATEKEAIRNALARNNGNKKAAAEELGISLRTIYRKISDYSLDN
ncbi:MAG: sigma-54 dependent transcriptional regulator [Muribaculaceae bacterium]|nr:sigma-54 dependent transcriptional regulator [Muribaculaceae bacterium]